MKRTALYLLLLILIASSAAAEFVPGEVIVKLKPRVGVSAAGTTSRSLFDKYRAREIKQIFPSTSGIRAAGSAGSELVTFKVDASETERVIDSLNNETDVEYAQPNYIYQLSTLQPSDQHFGRLWGMSRIEAPAAWEISQGSNNVVVAVVDSGLNYNHADISGNVWNNSDEIAGNGRDDDGNGFVDDIRGWDFANNDNDPNDDYGHGTHVAGIIAAEGGNGVGVSGVSWRAKIMPLKVSSAVGRVSTTAIIKGINYAFNNGANIINLSLGGYFKDYAYEEAVRLAGYHNVVVVAAAGNDNLDIGQNAYQNSQVTFGNGTSKFYSAPPDPATYPGFIPARYDGVICVASTDNYDLKSAFSNWGDEIDVAAPGNDILSLDYLGGYSVRTGTSMAAPHAAGLAALILSVNPELTNSQVKQIIESSVDDLGPSGHDRSYGFGRINARKALQLLRPNDLNTTTTSLPSNRADQPSSSQRDGADLNVYPNPYRLAEGGGVVFAGSILQNNSGLLKIYDVSGRQVWTTPFNFPASVNWGATEPGIYFYSVITAAGVKKNGKIAVVD